MIPILRLIAWLHLQSALVFASADVWLFFLVLAPKLHTSLVCIDLHRAVWRGGSAELLALTSRGNLSGNRLAEANGRDSPKKRKRKEERKKDTS